jgi:hypothetical protein
MKVFASSMALATLLAACAAGPNPVEPAPIAPLTTGELIELDANLRTLLSTGESEAVLSELDRLGPRLRSSLAHEEFAPRTRECLALGEDARILLDFDALAEAGYQVVINGVPGVQLNPGQGLGTSGRRVYAPRDCARCSVCSQLPALR